MTTRTAVRVLSAVGLLSVLAVTFPGALPFNHARPFVFGLPFVFAWVVLWVVIGGAALFFVDRSHRDER